MIIKIIFCTLENNPCFGDFETSNQNARQVQKEKKSNNGKGNISHFDFPLIILS